MECGSVHECDKKGTSLEHSRSLVLVLMQAYESSKGNKIVSLENQILPLLLSS